MRELYFSNTTEFVFSSNTVESLNWFHLVLATKLISKWCTYENQGINLKRYSNYLSAGVFTYCIAL